MALLQDEERSVTERPLRARRQRGRHHHDRRQSWRALRWSRRAYRCASAGGWMPGGFFPERGPAEHRRIPPVL